MRIKLSVAALAFLASSISLSAHAGFVSQSYLVDGDNKVTFDESSGLSWLKLSETQGLSINQVSAQLGAGGAFSGWRLPTGEEVEALFVSMFPELKFNNATPDATTFHTGSASRAYAYRWQGWMGSSSNGGSWMSYGIYTQKTATGVKFLSAGADYLAQLFEDLYSGGGYSLDYKNSAYGVFLVKGSPEGGVSDVPAPLVAMFGLGALFLAGFRRRQGSQ